MDENTKTETMDDFKDELEASFRTIHEGDILTGTVISVSEEERYLNFPMTRIFPFWKTFTSAILWRQPS